VRGAKDDTIAEVKNDDKDYQDPTDKPGGLDILQAISTTIANNVDDMSAGILGDPEFRRDAVKHIDELPSLCRKNPTSGPTLEETIIFEKTLDKFARAFKKHGLPKDFIRRVKRPSGSHSASNGLLLNFPPGTVPLTERETLVNSADSTRRMRSAGLTEENLCTLDLYFISTDINFEFRVQYDDRGHYWDRTINKSPDAPGDLFSIAKSFSQSLYRQRVTVIGIESVHGEAAEKYYMEATQNVDGWTWLRGKSKVWMPGCSNQFGSFEAGDFEFPWALLYRKDADGFIFGKLVLIHSHPCYPAVARIQRGTKTDHWQRGIFTVSHLDTCVILTSG
jgi:hypothetical protein